MTTPEQQWAREAMENAVREGGLERAIADVVKRAALDARNIEREACAKLCDDCDQPMLAHIIRQRSKVRA